ncbi:hypothetical protein WMY93_008444 [Mugilogobius chulae]|uniref:C3/C5 convertase n=1 Tax=Mugilogobius chulae TaxID=88201 RepID=A0AAW0PFY8_9GOBI
MVSTVKIQNADGVFISLELVCISLSLQPRQSSLVSLQRSKYTIEGGTFSLTNELLEGSLLRFECEEGFYPYPHLVLVCNYNDQWEPAHRRSKCRPVECPDPTVLENGNVWPSEPRYFYQNEIRYECYSGYKLYGPMRRTCLASGKWSGSHPVCRRDSGDHCPDPGVPPGGSKTGTLFDIGEKVTYACNDNNMILIGSEERVCKEDGLWSGSEPTCYYPHTYDTPIEVSHAFGRGIKNTFSTLEKELNVTQEGRKIKLSKEGILNMYIALDISSSISQEHISNSKRAVLTLIDKIASFSVTPNYDIVFFSSKLIEIVNILSFYGENKKSLADSVEVLRTYKVLRSNQHGTNLNAVFEKILEKMAAIKTRQPNFKDHQHVIIVFTDGGYNMGGKPTQTVEKIKSMVLMDQPKQREEHLDIYIFGVGAQIYDSNLKSLTVGPEEQPHYFRLQDLEQLHETFDDIINEDEIKGLCGLYRDYGDMTNRDERRKKYPWAMSISVMTPEKTSYCLGSLVTPRFVLTAAHCFTVDDLIDETKVEIAGGKQLDVVNITMHPKYNISSKEKQGINEFYDYDVALIELKKDVDISVSLRPICLPCTEETNGALRQTLTCKQQEQLLIQNNERIGFLTKKDLAEKNALVKLGENRPNCIIKALSAPGISTKNVSEVVTENFLCTGGEYPEVDKIACKGDSGGAVFKNHLNRTIQIALVSWGNKVMEKCSQVSCVLLKGVWCDCSLKGMIIANVTSLTNGTSVGSIIRYKCPRGYYAHPEPAYRCQLNHRWTPRPRSRPTCEMVECPDPNVLQNGYITPVSINRKYYHQSKITYHCNSGYTLRGPLLRTCLENGKWSGANPVCEQQYGDCPDPGVPPGGMRFGNRFEIGDKVVFTCKNNMILMGSEERECELNGQWSGTETSCYYKYTYDTPWEVSGMFGGEIKHTLTSKLVNKTQEGRIISLNRKGTLNILLPWTSLKVSMILMWIVPKKQL